MRILITAVDSEVWMIHANIGRDGKMAKYRKKPVVVEAFKYDGVLIYSNGEWYCPDWARYAFQNGTMYFDSLKCDEPPVELFIDTLEGKHHVSVGDFIIRGVHGELYPCKPDIFAKTYELVEE